MGKCMRLRCLRKIPVVLLLGIVVICMVSEVSDFQAFDIFLQDCETTGTDGAERGFYAVYLERCDSTVQHDGNVEIRCDLRFTAGESPVLQLPDTDVQLRITTESGRRSLNLTLNSAESLPFRDTLMFVLPPDWQTFDLQFYVSGGRSPHSFLTIGRDDLRGN